MKDSGFISTRPNLLRRHILILGSRDHVRAQSVTTRGGGGELTPQQNTNVSGWLTWHLYHSFWLNSRALLKSNNSGPLGVDLQNWSPGRPGRLSHSHQQFDTPLGTSAAEVTLDGRESSVVGEWKIWIMGGKYNTSTIIQSLLFYLLDFWGIKLEN